MVTKFIRKLILLDIFYTMGKEINKFVLRKIETKILRLVRVIKKHIGKMRQTEGNFFENFYYQTKAAIK